jgi:Domain of unknown function (DUF4430)
VRAGAAAPLALACALALAACGLGAGSTPGAVQLLVTRDFGAQVLHAAPHPKISGEETVMSLLLRNYSITTRYGGGFVQAIGGAEGGEAAGHPLDWFYYVNGIEAPKGAGATDVHPGDRIWWDLHDWSQTQDIPAVVGAYPEPFLNGTGGRRLPVRVECASIGVACQTVSARLRAAGVPAGVSALSAGGGAQILRVLVGTWSRLQGASDIAPIGRGPRASGVYATFGEDGRSLTLLDADGHAVQKLGAGAGLVAATRGESEGIVWVVTGTDGTGVQRAANALEEAQLRHRFALAVTAAGGTPLPAVAG